MAVKEKVRIKLKGYEHATVDASLLQRSLKQPSVQVQELQVLFRFHKQGSNNDPESRTQVQGQP